MICVVCSRACMAIERAFGWQPPSMMAAAAAALGGSSNDGHTSPLASCARITLVALPSPSSCCAHCTHSSRSSEPSGTRSDSSGGMSWSLPLGCARMCAKRMVAAACDWLSPSPSADSTAHCSRPTARSVDATRGSWSRPSSDCSVTRAPGSGSNPCTHTSGDGSSDIDGGCGLRQAPDEVARKSNTNVNVNVKLDPLGHRYTTHHK